jgi:hypothetical protein
MTDRQTILLLLAVFAGMMLVWYVFARFSYEIGERNVKMTWRILCCLPILTATVELDTIREARCGMFCGGSIFGNIFRRRGVLLELRRTTLSNRFWRRVYITPEHPDAFAAEVNRRIANLPGAGHA